MREPLSIVMLATKFYATSDMRGGLERSARRLCEQLLRTGSRVTVSTRNYDGLAARELIDGVMVYRLPIWGRSSAMISLSYLVQALWWLIRHRREYHLIHCHQSYAPATIGALAKIVLGKPVLVKVSTADVFSERRELERLPLSRIRRVLLKRVDRFVAVNRFACEEFGELGIDPARFSHIPNGVDLPSAVAWDPNAKRAARERLGLPWEPIVLFVGRLSAEKRLDALIDAWPRIGRVHPRASLVLVGDGGTFRNVETELRERVQTLGLQERVHFVGRVDSVLDYLLAADVFVLPSSTEGMSNALLEAMAVGLPVVATRIPGNAELIQEENTGLLVPPGDADALAGAITRLLSSPDEANRFAQAARRTVEKRFLIARVASDYVDLYDQLLTHTR